MPTDRASRAPLTDWLQARLDRSLPLPLYQQLHDLLLQAVLEGALPAGARFPSSRALARDLGVARNTVMDVFEQLKAQGCLVGAHGSGTFVADLSGERLRGRLRKAPGPAAAELSQRGASLVAHSGVAARQWGAFMPGVPELREFPWRAWQQAQTRVWRQARPELLSYAPAGGSMALRTQIATHLGASRGVRCTPEQVIVTTGTHQSVDLCARLLTDPGDSVVLEDPCYWGLRSTLRSLGLVLVGAPVDAQGLQLPEAPPDPRLILVTPSHQYPLGMVMSLARRQALLVLAHRRGCWVLEDDYDSDFRYGSRPLASLQGLDGGERVIYAGSFSKTLAPGLRVGYVVVPKALATAFARASAELYREGQPLQQQVLAELMAGGHLAAHVRRMRHLYARRRQHLLQLIEGIFGDALEVQGDAAGLHLVLRLPEAVDDVALEAAALKDGILVRALCPYGSAGAPMRGLLLGYGCADEGEMDAAWQRLARIIQAFAGRRVR